MFSLLITIISIALVAALALATLYYGSDAFNRGAAGAEASKLITQQQQLLGATELFIAREGRIPNGTDELVSLGYLKNEPLAFQAMPVAVAASTPWVMPAPQQQVVFVMAQAPTEVCRAYNARTMGMDGIAPRAHEGYSAQCFGARGAHKVVVAKSSEAVAAALGVTPAVLDNDEFVAAPLPAVEDVPAWVVVPGQSTGSDGNTPTLPAEPGASVVAVTTNTAQGLSTPVGGPADSGEVTFSNSGEEPATLVFSGVSAPYSLSASSCSAPAGGSCTVTVTLSASAPVGDAPAQTLVATGAGNGAVSTPLSGSVRGSVAEVLNGPNLTVTPNAWGAFDGLSAGAFTVRNAGNEPMTLVVTTLDVPFGYANGCVDVAPGATCSIDINWSWVTAPPMTYAVSLVFAGADQGNPSNLTVTGTLQGANVTTSDSFDLEGTYSAANANKPTRVATLYNTGNLAASLDVYPQDPLFQVAENNCANLQPGASCTVTLTMDTNWYYSGGPRVYTSFVVTGGVNNVYIYGSGVNLASELEWQDAGTVVDFGTGAYNTTTTRTKIVRNLGNKPWTPDGFVYNAPGLVGDEVTSNFAQACGSVDPGMQCTVTFTYSRKYSRPNWTANNVFMAPADFSNTLTMRGNTP